MGLVHRSTPSGLASWQLPHPLSVPFHRVCIFNGERGVPCYSPCPPQKLADTEGGEMEAAAYPPLSSLLGQEEEIQVLAPQKQLEPGGGGD